jgi:hypothetical protein
MKRLPNAKVEKSLFVSAYDLKRVMNILGLLRITEILARY